MPKVRKKSFSRKKSEKLPGRREGSGNGLWRPHLPQFAPERIAHAQYYVPLAPPGGVESTRPVCRACVCNHPSRPASVSWVSGSEAITMSRGFIKERLSLPGKVTSCEGALARAPGRRNTGNPWRVARVSSSNFRDCGLEGRSERRHQVVQLGSRHLHHQSSAMHHYFRAATAKSSGLGIPLAISGRAKSSILLL